ncbi:MAG: 50S ribosomal protein L3 [Candidatus Woesearchaeota archaeon]
MPKPNNPRSGSMQFWPRVRAKRMYPRIRKWSFAKNTKDALPLAFAGYKAGMTHITIIDNGKHSLTKGQEITLPVTIVECPPIKINSVRFYKKNPYGFYLDKEIFFKTDKFLLRKTNLPKSHFSNPSSDFSSINPDNYSKITITVYTTPSSIHLKKKPELFEICLGGSNKDKFEFVKAHHNKEITLSSVFKEGELVDTRAITKGKGFQGPVKRFGIQIRPHKSEKTKRGPGSLGGWSGQGHVMYRVPHAGQTGFHQRIDYNKQIMKISNKPEEINPKGGFVNYGFIKSEYVLIKGSVSGPKKRLILLTKSIMGKKPLEVPSIEYISLKSNQGK